MAAKGFTRIKTTGGENLLIKTTTITLVSENVVGTQKVPAGTCLVHTTNKKRPLIRAAHNVEQMEELLG